MSRVTRQEQQEKLKNQFNGSGIYIFKNITSGDLQLSKKTLDNKTEIRKGETFKGDSYFFNLVQENLIHCIETIQEKDQPMQKLILDQPEIVTTKGAVEFVVDQQPTQLTDSTKNENEENKDVLLCEGPLSGLEILE
jgi:hypothetical protein